jgi:hypothetical protein
MSATLRIVCGFLLFVAVASAQNTIPTNDPPYYGPYNAVFLPDGEGLKKFLVKNDTVTRADSPWTLYAWILLAEAPEALSPVAGLGNPEDEYSRYLATDGNKLQLWAGQENSISASLPVVPNKWHFIAATFDGHAFHLFSEGHRVATGKLDLGSVSGVLELAPPRFPWLAGAHFGGKIAGLSLLRQALSEDEIKAISDKPPNFEVVLFEEASKPWPFQTSQQAGYRAPQDPATLPRSNAPFSKPVKKTSFPSDNAALQSTKKNEWTLAGWKLHPAPDVVEPGEAISRSEFSTKDWWVATVPGTVLTTMVDQGVYPDPDYGLNNLAIPESLNKQDYWYRTEFHAPNDWKGRRLTLTFEGINYFAAVWLNGKSLGTIKGAFIRGIFDVTEALKLGQNNVLAVRVSPPPHPGIPHEQSIRAGAGENGGALCLDGPTFVDTEGWDWIPAIRDRDTGIWQAITLRANNAIRLGDPQIVTKLPLPDITRATVEINVPLQNSSLSEVKGILNAAFENVTVAKAVSLSPGKNEVKLSASEFPQLHIKNPRLWWPNGYGKPELYTLKLSFSENRKESDSKDVRFGIREITYEISLLDSAGHLRRVDYSPTVARDSNEQIVDITHEGIRNIPSNDPYPSIFPPEWKDGWKRWVASLKPGAENSAAVKPVEDIRATPFLTIRVNGVRIAARGGSWGMDDSRKRVSRGKLEPYFRLHRDANINIIRNWVGQNTEEVFFDLADEYGLLVWNDFWASTQSYNVEPEDPQLFLENARDTILRFRNHPSIAIWCGRNEGVPQPTLNEGLDQLIRTLDGTRYYTPTSNQVNLQNSGPYRYVDPGLYFTELNHGFSVETGTISFPTVEMWKTWIPEPDLWPTSDAWAYHDWHMDGNGSSAPFMAEIEKEFGAAASLEDFGRKAQMLNFVQHRAIFEGMNAHLWAPNTGRLLWMTQPAWPSSNWQIFSSDYDTQASYYAVKKASEMLHVQLDPTRFQVQIINSLPDASTELVVHAKIYSLENKLLAEHEEKKDAPTGTTDAFSLDLAPLLKSNVAFIKLELHNGAGKLLSDNFYWLGGETADYRKLNRLPQAQLAVTANAIRDKDALKVHVRLENTGTSAAIEAKLTLLNGEGSSRVLPAYYSDNYVSLLPGESKEIQIESPTAAAKNGVSLGVRGWNLPEKQLNVSVGGPAAHLATN